MSESWAVVLTIIVVSAIWFLLIVATQRQVNEWKKMYDESERARVAENAERTRYRHMIADADLYTRGGLHFIAQEDIKAGNYVSVNPENGMLINRRQS